MILATTFRYINTQQPAPMKLKSTSSNEHSHC